MKNAGTRYALKYIEKMFNAAFFIKKTSIQKDKRLEKSYVPFYVLHSLIMTMFFDKLHHSCRPAMTKTVAETYVTVRTVIPMDILFIGRKFV